MDAITPAIPTVSVSKLIQGVTKTEEKTSTEQRPPDTYDFDTILSSVLQPDQANQINEEELFAALIKERVFKLKGSEAAHQYHQYLMERNDAFTKLKGYPSAEQAANEALDALIATGTLNREEATAIRSEAFAAAQLDSNLAALYDSRGGGKDPTIAVATMEEALLKARIMIEKFDSGEQEASLFTGPYNTGAQDVAGIEKIEEEEEEEEEETSEKVEESKGGEEKIAEKSEIDKLASSAKPHNASFFVFNPESRLDGKLAITLPVKLSARTEALLLKDREGNELERGRPSEEPLLTDGRKRFRFEKAGKEYPKELVVEIHLNNGKVRQYEIEDSSKRVRRSTRVKGAQKA